MRSAALALVLSAGLAAPAVAKQFEEVLPARPGGLLQVEIDLGEGLRPDPGFLELGSHDVAEIRVRVDAEGWGSWGVDVALEETASKARLEVRVGGVTSWMFGGPNVRVFAWVPRGTALDVRSHRGPVRIADIEGSVRARTRSADLELRGVQGPVKLRAVNGSVHVEELVGDLEVTSSEGSIRAAWVNGDVEARTSGGEIEMQHVDGRVTAKTLGGTIELTEVKGPVAARSERGSVFASFSGSPAGSLETERGAVEVVIASDSAAELDARATRGSVEIASGIQVNGDLDAQHARGQIRGGGPLLMLRTSKGNVHLRRR